MTFRSCIKVHFYNKKGQSGESPQCSVCYSRTVSVWLQQNGLCRLLRLLWLLLLPAQACIKIALFRLSLSLSLPTVSTPRALNIIGRALGCIIIYEVGVVQLIGGISFPLWCSDQVIQGHFQTVSIETEERRKIWGPCATVPCKNSGPCADICFASQCMKWACIFQ